MRLLAGCLGEIEVTASSSSLLRGSKYQIGNNSDSLKPNICARTHPGKRFHPQEALAQSINAPSIYNVESSNPERERQ